MAIDFNAIKKEILRDVVNLAKGAFHDRKSEIEELTNSFLAASEANIKRWGEAMLKGDISKAELENLVRGEGRLLKVTLLEQAGISLIEIDKLRQGILDIVVKVVSKVVL